MFTKIKKNMKKKPTGTFVHLLSLVALLFMLSCKKQDIVYMETSKKASLSGNNVNPFRDMPKLPQPKEEIKIIKAESQPTTSDQKDEWAIMSKSDCKTELVTQTATFDEQLLLTPGSDVIYLGSVLDANSLPTGAYRPIVPIKRRPIKMSLSLQGVQGKIEQQVNATLGDTRQALSNMLNQHVVGGQPSEFEYSINQIHSEDQLRLAIGANFSLNKLAGIKASFSFNASDSKTRVVAKILQKYYTVDMGIPDDGVFVEEAPNPAKFGSYSPVYISSLTYGRMGLFFMESSYSITEVNAALEATISALSKFGHSAGGNISSTYKNILNSSSIKVYTTGGSGEAAVEAISGYDGFIRFIKSGGNFNLDSRGAILSYQLRNLSDYTIFKTRLSSTYEIRTCSTIPVFKNGQFVRNDDTGEFFIFMESALRRIPLKVLNKIFRFNVSEVAHYPNSRLEDVPKSTPISNDSELIGIRFSNTLYLRENNTLRLIPNMKTRLAYHFHYDNRTKWLYIGNSYEIGEPIKF